MPTLPPQVSSAEDGYSFIEVLIALAIMALAMLSIGMTIPRLLREDAAAAFQDRTIRFLREARWQARWTQSPVHVLFRQDRFTAEAAGQTRELRVPSGLDIAIVAVRDFSPADLAIVFLPDGSSTGARLTMTQGTARHAITIGWGSGSITRDE